MKSSTSLSPMFFSTLNPSELENFEVLSKSEKSEKLTIFVFMERLNGPNQRVYAQAKKKSNKPFSSRLNYFIE
jgi:hypothetical protein